MTRTLCVDGTITLTPAGQLQIQKNILHFYFIYKFINNTYVLYLFIYLKYIYDI